MCKARCPTPIPCKLQWDSLIGYLKFSEWNFFSFSAYQGLAFSIPSLPSLFTLPYASQQQGHRAYSIHIHHS